MCYNGFTVKRKIKKTIILTLGVLFLVFGFAGLMLPFLQGILFLLIGLALLSVCFPKMRIWIKNRTIHNERAYFTINKIETWLLKFVGEV